MDYVLSPKLKGGYESHTIPKGTKKMKNLKIPAAEGVNKVRPMPEVSELRASSFGGKLIGSGAFGKVYLATVTPDLKTALKDGINKGGAKVVSEFPETGAKVVVKIVSQSKKLTDDEFFNEVTRENVIHKELSVGHCYKIPEATRARCISQFVPKFYLSYVFGKPGRHSCVTVMEKAGSMTLDSYIRNIKNLRKSRDEKLLEMYTSVELIVCLLWLSGYAHGDLHRDNILVSKESDEVLFKIIDFGFAMKIPAEFVKLVASGITTMIKQRNTQSFADLWTKDSVSGMRLVNYSNRILAGRGFEWYNPDYKILQVLYNILPARQRKKLPEVRSKLWGVSLNNGASDELEEGEIRVTPVAPKPKWVPISGRYWADEPSPQEYVAPNPVPKPALKPAPKEIAATPGSKETGKVDAKKRKVFENSKGRTYVKADGKRVYVKKLFTPKASPRPAPKEIADTTLTPGSKEIDKVDAKKRKVFENSKGRTYVKADGKRVYVKKLFTPKASPKPAPKEIAATTIAPGSKETGKVDAKKRKVFENSKGRTYVKGDGGKKVYVKKLFTPRNV
jgi:serine/threonine protein kinase